MAQMQAADFFRLRPLRNKTGVHIQIIQRRGMPFFFLRNKKRKAFFTGMILGGILIFFLTGESGISTLKEMSETVPEKSSIFWISRI